MKKLRLSRGISFNQELNGSEARLELYWNEILRYLRRDLAYVWTNRVRWKFKLINNETKKISYVFKKLRAHYSSDSEKYKQEVNHLKNLLWEINSLYNPNGKGLRATTIKKINEELKDIIKDVEYEKRKRSPQARELAQAGTEVLAIDFVLPDAEVDVNKRLLEDFKSISNIRIIVGDVWKAKFNFRMNNAEYMVSSLFFDEDYRLPACLAWVKADGQKYHLNVCYQSESQGLWRIAYSRYGAGATLSKAVPENRLNLPNKVQLVFSKIFNEQLTSTTIPQKGIMLKLIPQSSSPIDIFSTEYFELQRHTKISRIKLIEQDDSGSRNIGPPRPETIRFVEKYNPDFNRVIADFEVVSLNLGELHGKIIQSKNRVAEFLFLYDNEKRIWLANVDIAFSPICKYGLNVECAALSNWVTMPANEYISQIPKGYAGRRIGAYYDASAYIDKILIMEQFRKFFNLEKSV